jgi:erythronate-4-phosphate dehydrogenase
MAAAMLKLASEFRFNLAGKKLGIIGVGNVGSRVEKLAKLLGINVLLNDPPRARKEGDKNFVSLGEILYNSDIVTLHVPLNIVGEDSTYHLFDDKTFKKMKKGTWFINTSRGEVVMTQCLKKALDSGKFGGAILDVWEHEPDIDIDLMAKTFLSTPHIAGYSTDGKAKGTSIIVNALCHQFNLPLKEWFPQNIPEPEIPEIHIDGKGKTDEAVILEAVLHTYNIDEDNISLRFSPSDFEKQRGDYRVRREFAAFNVSLTHGSNQARKVLEGLGFRII